MVEFHKLCPEGSPSYNDIYTFFRKIIKTRKNEPGEGDGADDDYDAGDDDELDDEDEEETEESYKFNQEEHKIDDIEKLRDHRMELHNEKQHIESSIADLETNRKKLAISEETIKNTLEETEELIQEFQKEKMDKLNQLQVSILLKISQIQNLEKNQDEFDKWERYREEHPPEDGAGYDNSGIQGFGSPARAGQGTTKGKDATHHQHFSPDHHSIEEDYRGYFLPESLSDSTLFSREILLNLINRKRELDQQIDQNNLTIKQQKEEEKAINKEIKTNQEIKKQKDEEYKEKQMLRFGDIVELDSLEVSGPSAIVIDLRNEQLKKEKA